MPGDDTRHMRAALALARRALGNCAPNPAVGCILVNDGRVVGRGWTQRGGRPHAETEALRRTGPAAHGATAYVSLEPCSHHGETGPCADALIAAGVSRCVIALEDPDPRVSGRGIARLRDSGLDVCVGAMEQEAAIVNAGFLLRMKRSRPLVTWKTATSLDGRIAAPDGKPRWITGEAARRRAHLIRARHDAIAVGVGTVLADDPALTCRLRGLEDASPIKVVFDSHARTPTGSRLVAETNGDLIVFCLDNPAVYDARCALASAGAEIIAVGPDANGRIDLIEALRRLADRGVTRLMIEGGGALSASFLEEGLIDRIAWFRAPCVIGGDGVPVAMALGIAELSDAPRFALRRTECAGPDRLEIYHSRHWPLALSAPAP